MQTVHLPPDPAIAAATTNARVGERVPLV
jgi:hypothetical protein